MVHRGNVLLLVKLGGHACPNSKPSGTIVIGLTVRSKKERALHELCHKNAR